VPLLQVVLAMHDIADELVAKVKAGVAKLTVGRPEDNADITPVVSEASANFIQVGKMFLCDAFAWCRSSGWLCWQLQQSSRKGRRGRG
jgi:delta 1-pyrroline-5-carboxylate dehydrogenase